MPWNLQPEWKDLRVVGLTMIIISVVLIGYWAIPTSVYYHGDNWTPQPMQAYNKTSKAFYQTGSFYTISDHRYFYALAGQSFHLYSKNGTFSMTVYSVPSYSDSKDNYGTSGGFKKVDYVMKDSGLHYYEYTADGNVLSPYISIETHQTIESLLEFVLLGTIGVIVYSIHVIKRSVRVEEKQESKK